MDGDQQGIVPLSWNMASSMDALKDQLEVLSYHARGQLAVWLGGLAGLRLIIGGSRAGGQVGLVEPRWNTVHPSSCAVHFADSSYDGRNTDIADVNGVGR
jgi:hypothetical protein